MTNHLKNVLVGWTHTHAYRER